MFSLARAAARGAPESLDELLTLCRGVDPDAASRLLASHEELLALRPALSARYVALIRAREEAEARALLRAPARSTVPLRERLDGSFGRRAYDRVSDLFSRLSLDPGERLVMVGPGPLPVTLFHIRNRCQGAILTGLDINPEAVTLARAVVRHLGITDLDLDTADGREVSFAGARVVYIANLVSPKRAVLDQVARTADPGTLVVVREPFALGALLAERAATAPLPPGLRALGTGPGDARFLSRHDFLTVVPTP